MDFPERRQDRLYILNEDPSKVLALVKPSPTIAQTETPRARIKENLKNDDPTIVSKIDIYEPFTKRINPIQSLDVDVTNEIHEIARNEPTSQSKPRLQIKIGIRNQNHYHDDVCIESLV